LSLVALTLGLFAAPLLEIVSMPVGGTADVIGPLQ